MHKIDKLVDIRDIYSAKASKKLISLVLMNGVEQNRSFEVLDKLLLFIIARIIYSTSKKQRANNVMLLPYPY